MLKSKLKVKRKDELLLAIFYTVVGIVQIIVLALANFRLFTSGVLAVLSFIAAYGLLTAKKWSVWLVIGLFFPQFVFGATIILASMNQQLSFMLLSMAPAVIVIGLSFISFVYVAAKRKSFLQA
jgi:hypothetical protein